MLLISAVLALAIAIAAIILLPVPEFPEPSGAYAIGTRTYHWTDHTRPEPFTTAADDNRELIAQVWYPAATGSQGEISPYLASGELRDALAKMFGVPGFLLRSIERAPTHAIINAEPADGRFPVLIHISGYSGYRNSSTYWIEELVSHGYVVVGLDQPGSSAVTVFPSGRTIPVLDRETHNQMMELAINGSGDLIAFLAQDVSFSLDQIQLLDTNDPVLAGHLDTERAAAFGMSLGSFTAAEACHRDDRLRACLMADSGFTKSVTDAGLSQPFMIMARSADGMRRERDRAGGWPDEEIAFTVSSQEVLVSNSTGPAYFLHMDSLFHMNWTDAPVLSPIIRLMGLTGPVDPYCGFAAINAYSVAFFDEHLKGQAAPLPENVTDDCSGPRPFIPGQPPVPDK